jgi:hypothetical protein
MATEAMHIIVPDINEEHSVQIKNSYYSCIYLTRILHCFNTLNLKIVSVCHFLKNGVHSLFGGAGCLIKYSTLNGSR